jgi:hypothetical protein
LCVYLFSCELCVHRQLTVKELDHVIELAQDHGLGILLEEETAKDILHKGVGIRHEKADLKEKK